MISISKYITRPLIALSLTAPLFSSCYNYDHEEMIENTVREGDQYINLTISVSAGSQAATRAPEGGEDGDGREVGFSRENAVTGITLVLYDVVVDINSTADADLAFVHYYPTQLDSRKTQGTALTGKKEESKLDEAVYTTGDQLVERGTLTFGKKYNAIVVANRNLAADLKGKKLSDVKNLVYGADDLYDGAYGQTAANCRNFMMSSESVTTIDLTSPKEVVANNAYYRPTDAIRIERLAARIDFWAAGATYQNSGIYNNRNGYVYNVDGSSAKLVVVSITPFNLYKKGTAKGGEYLLKNLNLGWLKDETDASYVLDPSTADKTSANVSAFSEAYLNPLSQIYTDLNASTPKVMSAAGTTAYYQTVEAMHDKISAQGGYGDTFDENVVVAYPMENTIPAGTTAPLYTYATGIAIEADYYATGDLTAAPTGTRVYIGYLMHQNSTTTYSPFKSDDVALTTTLPSSTPMNYGVVRNNIYRVSIDKINPDTSLELKIKVKMWDDFWHDYIYM